MRDNTIIAPANQLPLLRACRAFSAELPEGNVLVILPAPQSPARSTFERFAAEYQRQGRPVTTVSLHLA